jgi:hypothetical protein
VEMGSNKDGDVDKMEQMTTKMTTTTMMMASITTPY